MCSTTSQRAPLRASAVRREEERLTAQSIGEEVDEADITPEGEPEEHAKGEDPGGPRPEKTGSDDSQESVPV